MQPETFNLKGLAQYLGRDARDLEKLASQGRLPGHRVAGDWRFHRAEVHHWLEQELPSYSDSQLQVFEDRVRHVDSTASTFLLRDMFSPSRIAVPLKGRTAQGVIRSLVELANDTWQIFDPPKVFDAIWQREQLASTAAPGGVALPHPGRRLVHEIGESMIVYGRTTTGIPFGGPHGQLTDIFFLLLCQDDRTHLYALARLARLLQHQDFLERLRAAEDPSQTFDTIMEFAESVDY